MLVVKKLLDIFTLKFKKIIEKGLGFMLRLFYN